ncbi:MAG: helix-turn-helix domain-containing protein [Flavipsychrobacter sp.]|nr:helix-turn-helix domain-containing protein [Flavipsychrobacter sp.]
MKNKIIRGHLSKNRLPDSENRRCGNTDNILTPEEIQLHLTLKLDGLIEQWELLMEKHRKRIVEDIRNVRDQKASPTEFLTVKEVQSLLRIGKGALYKIINTGALPTVKIGGKRLFQKADIEKYLTQITQL